MDSSKLQRAYENLGRELVAAPSDEKKRQIMKEFCRVHDLPYVHSDGTVKKVKSGESNE